MKTKKSQPLTELTLVGTPREVSILAEAATRSGRLVWRSVPQRTPGDPRIRVVLKLQPTV